MHNDLLDDADVAIMRKRNKDADDANKYEEQTLIRSEWGRIGLMSKSIKEKPTFFFWIEI